MTSTIAQKHARRGTGLIEVLVAAAVVTLLVIGITSVYRLAIRSSREAIRGTQSSLLAEEGLEAVRVIRDASWDAIDNASIGISYTLTWTGTTWALTTTPSMIDGTFDRRVVFQNVYRDASDDIAESGTLDGDTVRVNVTISWNTGTATTSRTVSTYIGNLFE
jgi:Tfp pilus assembly protein PilV